MHLAKEKHSIFADKIAISVCVFFEKCVILSDFRHFTMTCRAVAEKRDIIFFKDKL